MGKRSERRWIVNTNATIRQVTRSIMKTWDVSVGEAQRHGRELPGEHPADWTRLMRQIDTMRAYLDSMERVAIREHHRQAVIHAGGDDPQGSDA